MVNGGAAPPRLDTLLQHSLLLRRVATVASREDREQVEQMRRLFEELAALDMLLWGEDKQAYGVVSKDMHDVVTSSQQALNQLSQDLYRYGEWLSHHLD